MKKWDFDGIAIGLTTLAWHVMASAPLVPEPSDRQSSLLT